MANEGTFGREFPAAVVSSGKALFQCPLCVTTMGQEPRRVMSGWRRLIWPTHHTTSVSLQSHHRTFRCYHPALPKREHKFILRTSSLWMWAPASSSVGDYGGVLHSLLASSACVL